MVFEKVRKIVSKGLSIPEDKVTLDSSIIDDLGADSIDAVEIIMAIEEEFNIEVSDDVMKDVMTIADMVAFIEKKVK